MANSGSLSRCPKKTNLAEKLRKKFELLNMAHKHIGVAYLLWFFFGMALTIFTIRIMKARRRRNA
jgi:hypothetical protein